jgi:hypothetical protein
MVFLDVVYGLDFTNWSVMNSMFPAISKNTMSQNLNSG